MGVIEMLNSIQGHTHYFEVSRIIDNDILSVCRFCGEAKLTKGVKC